MPKLQNGNATTTTSRKPAAPAKGAADAAAKAVGRPVIYPEVITSRCFGEQALTYSTMVGILGFETEEQYIERLAKDENLKSTKGAKLPEKLIAFKHELTGPAQLQNNAGNRPLNLTWAESIAQDILARQWVGPTTMPELKEYTYGGSAPYKMRDGTIINPGDKIQLPDGTINGETMVISRSGLVKSAQHRGVGFILAVLEWRRNPDKYKALWPTEPVLETLITYGVSDHERVTTTMDTTLARTEADSFYSTGAVARIFGAQAEKMDKKKQAEACRMLQACVDFLWMRVGKGEYLHQTHSATQKFLDDHPKIYEAVRHIWEENQDRQLSLIRLSAGQCAASLYMMSAMKSDKTKWDAQSGTQRDLDLGLWKEAKEFWSMLAGKTGQHRAIADTIAALMDDPNAPSRGVGKLAIVAKAWHILAEGKKLKTVKDGEKLTSPDLELEYGNSEEGRVLVNAPGFGGIDLGPRLRKLDDGEEPTEEQQAAEKKRIREAHASALLANRTANGQAPGEVAKPAPVAYDKDGKPPAPVAKKPVPAKK